MKREQVRLSASLDLQRWVQQRTSHGWGRVEGSLQLGPTQHPPAPAPTLPSFDRQKAEKLGWEVREVFPGTQYELAKGPSWIEATGTGVDFEVFGFREASAELRGELGQVLEAFGIEPGRIQEVGFDADESQVFEGNINVPVEAIFWLDAETAVVTRMAVDIGGYDPETGGAGAGPTFAITLSFKYGVEGPKQPEQAINERFAELVFDSAVNGTTTLAALTTSYYEANGKCPDAIGPELLTAEFLARGYEWPRNAYQERPMQESDTFSAGDFRYERVDDDTCRLTGWDWGREALLDIPYHFPE